MGSAELSSGVPLTKLDLGEASHRRLNPLTGEWTLGSPHRMHRPWQGEREAVAAAASSVHDPNCYLCPRNVRANGARNPDYPHTFVFDNDFGALHPDAPPDRIEDGLLVAEGESGLCRVLCFSPRHDLTLAQMEVADIERVVDAWVEETITLGSREGVASVQIFENRGEIMGCSNPHPHGQIWATRHLPNELEKETRSQTQYSSSAAGSCSSTISSRSSCAGSASSFPTRISSSSCRSGRSGRSRR